MIERASVTVFRDVGTGVRLNVATEIIWRGGGGCGVGRAVEGLFLVASRHPKWLLTNRTMEFGRKAERHFARAQYCVGRQGGRR